MPRFSSPLGEALYEHFIETMPGETLMFHLGAMLHKRKGLGVLKCAGSWAWFPGTPLNRWAYGVVFAHDSIRNHLDGVLHKPDIEKEEFLKNAMLLYNLLTLFGYDEDGARMFERVQNILKSWPS